MVRSVTNHASLIPEPEPFITTTPTPVEPGWLDTATAWATNPDNTMTAVAAVMAALLAINLLRRRKRNTTTGSNSAEDITSTDRLITRTTALIATFVVAQGMWVFFTEVINIHWAIRLVLFSFIEMQIISALRRTRRYLYRHGNLGAGPFTIVGLATVTATLAAVHVNTFDERLFRLFAAAVAAHMLIEELREERDILRFRNPDKWPPLPKWTDIVREFLARIGLAEPASITVTEVATQRRIDRLSRLLNHFHAVSADGEPGKLKRLYLAWLTRRVVRKTQAACKYINLAENPQVRAMLLRRLSVVRGIVDATRPADGQGRTAWAVEVAATGDAIVGELVTPLGDTDTRQVATVTDTVKPAVTATDDSDTPVCDTDTITPARRPTATIPSTLPHRHTVTATVAPAATATRDTDTRRSATSTDTRATRASDTATDTRATATTASRVGGATATANRVSSATDTPGTDVARVRPLRRDLISDQFREWTSEQIEEFAGQRARAVAEQTGNKTTGMKAYFYTCLSLGVEVVGARMAAAVGANASLGRRLAKQWHEELLMANAEQILLDAMASVTAEVANGGGSGD